MLAEPEKYRQTMASLIGQAIVDPGSFLERADRDNPDKAPENITRWSMRAVMHVLDIPEGAAIPAGLAVTPQVRFKVHCSNCGKPTPGYEYAEMTPLWDAEDLSKLGNYHLQDCNWKVNDGLIDPEFGGRALVCPECWQVAWCEDCDEPIHAWQEAGHGKPGEDWHLTCRANIDALNTITAQLAVLANIGAEGALPALTEIRQLRPGYPNVQETVANIRDAMQLSEDGHYAPACGTAVPSCPACLLGVGR